MNTHYDALLRAIEMPDRLIELAAGQITSPVYGVESPASWYWFPPVLIPICSDGSSPSYLGIWKHWFVDRPISFVRFYAEWGGTFEISRTVEQFFCTLIISALSLEGEVTSEIEDFAAKVGVDNLDEIVEVMIKTGDNPNGFHTITEFHNDLPLESTSDPVDYTGNFPSADFSRQKWWLDACRFEIEDEVYSTWPAEIPLPGWLSNDDRMTRFQSYLSEDNLHAAWLTLNSPGWPHSKH